MRKDYFFTLAAVVFCTVCLGQNSGLGSIKSGEKSRELYDFFLKRLTYDEESIDSSRKGFVILKINSGLDSKLIMTNLYSENSYLMKHTEKMLRKFNDEIINITKNDKYELLLLIHYDLLNESNPLQTINYKEIHDRNRNIVYKENQTYIIGPVLVQGWSNTKARF